MIHPQPVTAPPAIGGAFLVAARLDEDGVQFLRSIRGWAA
jgi:hypothetical protein